MKTSEKPREEAISKLIDKYRDEYEEFLLQAHQTSPPIPSIPDQEIAYLCPYGELAGIVRILERLEDLVLVELLCDAWIGQRKHHKGDEVVVNAGWLS